MAFSPDGKTLAIIDYENQLRFWDIKDAIFKGTIQLDDSLSRMIYSPDGETIAGVSSEEIVLVDLKSKSTTVLKGHWKNIYSLAFSPDSKVLVTGANDATIRIWNLGTNKSSKPILAHEGSVTRVAFSPDGSHIASAGSYEDGTIALWDDSGKEVQRIQNAYENSVVGLQFSDDGKSLLCVNASAQFTIWDMGTETIIMDMVLAEPNDTTVNSTPENNCYFSWNRTENKNQIKVWRDLNLFQRAQKIRASNPEIVAAPQWDSQNLRFTNHLPKLELPIPDFFIKAVEFNREGRWLMIAGNYHNDGPRKGSYLLLWNAEEEKMVRIIPLGENNIERATFSPNGKYIATLTKTKGETVYEFSPSLNMINNINIYDASTGKLKRTFTEKYCHIYDFHFYPDGEKLIISFVSQEARVVSIESVTTGEVVHIFSSKNPFSFIGNEMGISPDGKRLAFVSQDSKVIVWNATTFRKLYSWRVKGDLARCAFSPDGQTLAVQVNNDKKGWSIILLNIQIGREITHWKGAGYGTKMKFTPDGENLFIGTDGLYDVLSGKRHAGTDVGDREFDISSDGKVLFISDLFSLLRVYIPDFRNDSFQKVAKLLRARGVDAKISRDQKKILQIKFDLNGRRSYRAFLALKDLNEPFELTLTDHSTLTDDKTLAIISSLRHLQGLSLDGERVTDLGLKQLQKLGHLRKLSLTHMNNITSEGWSVLASLNKLEEISLDSKNLTNDDLKYIGKLKNLQKLTINSWGFTGEGLSHLQGLDKLTELKLLYASLSKKGMMNLSALTQLKSLYVHDIHFASEGIKAIKKLTRLQKLNIESTKITDADLVHLKGLALQQLYLPRGITDMGLAHLSEMQFLTELHLRFHKEITDAGMPHLKNLRELEVLNLEYTKVTDLGLQSLNDLTKLRLLIPSEKMTIKALHSSQQKLPKLFLK